MYNKQPLEAGILYKISLCSKKEFNVVLNKHKNKNERCITKKEKIKQLEDALDEINSKIKTLNEKIANLNKEKKYNEGLIEKDKIENNEAASEVHTRWLNRTLVDLEKANKSLNELQLEENAIKIELSSKRYFL